MTQEETIIAFIEQHKIDELYCEFDCGGDSMGDVTYYATNEDGEEVDITDIESDIDDIMYQKVEFYEASDGHYIGESGRVDFTVEEDGAEKYLVCSKSSKSEWNEQEEFTCEVTLSDKELVYLNDNIASIGRERWHGSGDIDVEYSRDFITSPEEEELEEVLLKKIEDAISKALDNTSFEGDPDDDGTDPSFELEAPFTNPLQITAAINVIVYKDDE